MCKPFIALEGLDGAGKTTMINKLKEDTELQEKMINATGAKGIKFFREPGGLLESEKIRETIMCSSDFTCIELAALFTTARSVLLRKEIIPALQDNYIVILDRFIASTYAYQGVGMRLDELENITNAIIPHMVNPHYIFLNISTSESIKRLKARMEEVNALDSFDESVIRERAYLYSRFFIEGGNTYTPINADRDVDNVYNQLTSVLLNICDGYRTI